MFNKQTSVSHSSTEAQIVSRPTCTHGWNFRSWSLVVEVLHSSFNQRKKSKEKVQETCCVTNHQENTPTRKLKLKFSTKTLIYPMSMVFLQTWSLLTLVLCFAILKAMKRWLRWSSKAEVQQWDTYPDPTELRLIGYLTESTWTQRTNSNTLTPKTNSQTFW